MSSSLRGLAWKETRQVVPLVIMLLGVAVLLFVLWSTMSAAQTMANFGHYIPLVLPALFAAGVGAILVGQEKENRTMDWCSSLPISPSLIVLVKLAVAIIGLLVMWVCCALIGSLAGNSRLPGHEAGVANSLYWFTHSIFILCCGFYTAWRMKNTFASLIVLIPLAALPYLATSIYYSLFMTGRHVSLQESAWLLTLASAIGIIVMAWMGYRAGIRDLSPARPELEATGPGHWLAAWRPAHSLPVPETPFRYPLSSLIWQSIHHNRMTLTLLILAMLSGAFAFGYMAVSSQSSDEFGMVMVCTFVAGAIATSWLGVFVFHGDGSASRLRFLADRGVSPTRAWIGRHLIGLSAIAVAMIAFLISSFLTLRNPADNRVDVVPSMAMVGAGLWVIYAVSQATSQWIRILAASAFIAPILSGVALYWLGAAAISSNAPFWLLAVCCLLPMLATWLMMRRFMDNSAKWPIWACGVVTTVLFLVLPILPFAIDVASFPGITPSARASLAANSKKLSSTGNAQPMMRASVPLEYLQQTQHKTDINLTELVASQRFLPEDYLEIGDIAPDDTGVLRASNPDNRRPLRADRYILSRSIEFANYFRYLVTQNPEDSDAVESLGKWIDALTEIAVRLRRSDRWYDQHAADNVEIWLTQTLSRQDLMELRSRDFSQRAIAVLADQAGRSAARRRAVLLSWRREMDPPPMEHDRAKDLDMFGGFRENDWFLWYPQEKVHWIQDRLLDRLCVAALQLIDAAENGQDTLPMRRELHELMDDPSIPFANSWYGERLQPRGVSYGNQFWNSPAVRWYRDWENQAKELASSSESEEP
ncbi:ABC transporter permease [Allorhodopirellula solitaria]|nr:hypothetical protein [Allorhodopirellula solitaria]